MIANIIPSQKLPRSLSILSYKIPLDLEDKIKIGQLVTIPLRQKITTGVIYNLSKSPKLPHYPLKNILHLINQKSVFTPEQLKLFVQLAEYYHISASLLVHFNLPQLIKKDWQKLSSLTFKPFKPNKIPQSLFFWWLTKSELNKFYLQQINSAKKNKSQLLIVVPRINQIAILAKELKLKKTDYLIIHRQLSRAENVNAYLQTTNYKLQTVFIGTRSSLFYPFTQLKTIIIHDEHSLDHKQYDMNPRYDTKTVAEKINQIYKTQIILSSPSPSLGSYTSLSPKRPKQIKKDITLADLNNELAKKNYSFISEQLFTQIKQTLNLNKPVFLFINKKGEASATHCRDCNFSFNCPSCELPLIKTQQNKFICYYCDYLEDMPPFCPQCSGPNFQSTGLGIQKIESNLKKLFPRTNIIRLDKDIKKSLITNYQLPITIFVGTQFALDKIPWSKIKLVGIINADQLWQHAEFASAEKAYQILIKLLTLAPQDAKFIIQTFNPAHYIIKSISQNKPGLFYHQELKFRKKFDYPPFTNLIKLSYLNKSELKAKKETQKIYNKLSHSKKITLSPPLPILRRKIRGRYKYNLILKLNHLNDFKLLAKLIPHDWLIDIHPRTLLD